MRHPDIALPGAVPETALEHWRARGWIRVSDALSRDEYDQLRPEAYVDAPDLDAEPPKQKRGGKNTDQDKE